jgi:hypothetical protein
MNWFAQRRVIEVQNELLRKLVDEKDKRIALLERQNAELKALFDKTSQFEVVEQGEDRLTLKMKPLQPAAPGRSGFRARRSKREEQTHSTPNDSVAALEKRAQEAS